MRATAVLPTGTWDSAGSIDSVLLDFDDRHRRRVMLHTERGNALLLDLPRTARLRDGDGLSTQNGVVRVRAKPEPLLDIHAHDPGALVRIAWHLGNRHLPIQLFGDRIRIRSDHVVADMIAALGAYAEAIEAPFDPEPGAYGGAHQHGHDHEH